jgi:hypothetical protein
MIAYLHRAPGGKWCLTFCARPCTGEEFQKGEKLEVSGKREANAICKTRGVKPWNW